MTKVTHKQAMTTMRAVALTTRCKMQTDFKDVKI